MESLGDTDNYQHISLQVTALKMSGLWFYIYEDRKSWVFWIIALSQYFYGILICVLPITAQLSYLTRLILSKNFEIQEVAGIMNLVLTELLISLKLLDLSCRRSFLLELKEQMQRKEFMHFSFPSRNIIKKSIKLSRRLFFWLVVSAAVDIAVHIVVVPAINSFQELPVKMDFIFFDVNKKYFNFLYAYQILYKPIILVVFSSLQTMRWAFMLCTISQLDVLIYNFENMKELVKARNCEINEAFKDRFKKSIVHHCAIIKFVDTFAKTFGGQFLLCFLISSIIICTTAVQFVSIKISFNNLVDQIWIFGFLFIFVIILYIDCFFGSIITEKGSYMSTIIYCFPWTDLPQEMKKNFILYIFRNQQDLIIEASKLIPVSLTTFTKIMNWTYKGFAVLNQMKK